MVRDGLFKDVDAVVAWHPGDVNDINGTSSQGNITGKFRFPRGSAPTPPVRQSAAVRHSMVWRRWT
jgi:hypothetical protein